jgi:hypothetical protein
MRSITNRTDAYLLLQYFLVHVGHKIQIQYHVNAARIILGTQYRTNSL